ncbi:MAG: tetratricopeptide repeat protein [Bacteroidetes bacterium]|nr:MAG: tetratricopeptide repeat protein [Bacteroidota bacterium]
MDEARSLLDAGRYREAAQVLDGVLASRVLMSEPWALRGYARFRMGDYTQAIADYSHALMMERTPTLYYNRALAYKRTGMLREALIDLDAALRINPDAVAVLFERGNVLAEMGQWAEAARWYERTLERAPEYRPAWLNLAKARMETNQTTRALEALDAALALEVDSHALRMRSRCWLLQNRLAEAWEDAIEALYLDPDNADVYYLIGRIEQQQGEQEAALRSFEAAVEVEPAPRYWLAQAQALFEVGDYYRVVEACNEVLHLEPENPMAWELRDKAYGAIEDLHRQWSVANEVLVPQRKDAYGAGE